MTRSRPGSLANGGGDMVVMATMVMVMMAMVIIMVVMMAMMIVVMVMADPAMHANSSSQLSAII